MIIKIDVIFWKLFSMSIAAGWLILAVIVLRLFLRKVPRWWFCILWAMTAVRLICPYSFESAFSLIPSVESMSLAGIPYEQEAVIDGGIPAMDDMSNQRGSGAFVPVPDETVNPWSVRVFIAGIVWAVGMTVMIGYAFISFLRVRGKVREAVVLQDNVWLCDAVKSPFILGIIRPRIYLSSGMDPEQMKYVLAHEQAHLKRGDHLWKPFGYLLLAVYWFHPLIWVAYMLFCRDIELACDEKVIRNMVPGAKKAYCRALLACSIKKKMVMACPLAFGEVGVKERIKIVLHYRKPGFWAVAAGGLACVVAAACFLTDPKKETVDIRAEEYEKDILTAAEEQASDDRSDTAALPGDVRSDTAALPEDVKSDDGLLTFNGVIVENTMDSVEPMILVRSVGNEIPYDYICFVLPDEEADWDKQVNSVVTITCKDSFEESRPVFGELISIERAASSVNVQAMFDTFGIAFSLLESLCM